MSRLEPAGAALLSECPSHWKSSRLGHAGRFVAGTGFPDEYQGLQDQDHPFFKVGDMGASGNEIHLRVAQHSINDRDVRELGARICPPGAIAFAKVGAALLLNRRRITERPCVFDNNMMAFVPSHSDPRFLKYWLEQVDFGQLSNPGPVPSINEGQLNEIAFPAPPINEQVSIANFVDRKTSSIDALIAKKERLVALLTEKRQALITQAVTKGLDPGVSMKETGIDWIGTIPASWNIRPLGLALRFIGYGFTNPMPTTNDGPFMVTANDVQDGVVDYEGARKTDPAEFARLTRKCKPKRGDILVTKDGTLGRVAVHDGRPACVNQSVAVLSTNEALASVDFVQNALRSELYQERMLFEAGGTTIKHIYISRLAKMPMALPPVDAQERICEFLLNVRKTLEAAAIKTQSSLDSLREYRQALITAAVTGKLDIPREAA